MDYKEKYEQALERCKEEFNFNNLAYSHEEIKQKLKRVFPELEESEDVRIKYEIVAFIEQSIHRGGGTPIPQEQENRWLAWLDKQGEIKPASKMQVSEKLYEHIRNTCACISDALGSKTLVDVNDYLEQADADAQSAFDMIEKQIEQTPAWSDEDENLLNLSLDNLTELKNRFGEKYGKVGDCIDWLKALRQRMKGETK